MIVLAAFDMVAAVSLMVLLVLMMVALFWLSRGEDTDGSDGE